MLRMAPWRRAPFLVARSPSVLAAIVAAGMLLALAVAARPVFVGSAEAAAVQSDLTDGCRYDIGLRIQTGRVFGSAAPDQASVDRLPERTRLLADATRMRGVLPPVVTVGAGNVEVLRDGVARGQGIVQLFSRTGAFDKVHVLSRAPGDPDAGLWLPDTTAALMHARAGDVVPVALGSGRTISAPVAAVFQDLTYVDRDHFWCTLDRQFQPLGSNPLPPVALVSQALMLHLLQEGGGTPPSVIYEAAPADRLSMPRAEAVDRRLRAARQDLVEQRDTGTGAGFGFDDGVLSHFTMPDTLTHARLVGRQVRTTADTIGAASTAIALVAVAGAGFFWVDRRRREIALLLAKGVGPAALSLKALLESALPLLAGTAVGFAIAVEAVYAFGPSDAFDARAVRGAARLSVVAIAVALGLLALAVAIRTGRAERRMSAAPRSGRIGSRVIVPAAAAVALGAATVIGRSAGYTQLRSGGRPSSLGLILVVFPLLVLGGGAAAVVAIGGWLLPRTRRWASRWPVAAYLAVRRIAAGGPAALALIAGAVVSAGVLLYASTVATSARKTVIARATVSVGSDNLVFLADPRRPVLPPALRKRGTTVMSTALVVGRTKVDVLGIDPKTFAAGAFYDRSFSGQSLSSLIRAVEHQPGGGSGEIPVVVVDGSAMPDQFSFKPGDPATGARVVARVRAFPGMSGERPMLVADESLLRARGVTGTEELWVKGETAEVVAELNRAHIGTSTVVRAKLNEAASSLLPLATSLGYFKALGLLGGAVTLAGAVFYLASGERARRLAAVMARGMGLTRRTSRRALAIEMAALLVAGTVVGGVLSLGAARITFPHLDPAPTSPPPLIFRVDRADIVWTLITAMVAAALMAGASTWTSWRRPPAEVMRDA